MITGADAEGCVGLDGGRGKSLDHKPRLAQFTLKALHKLVLAAIDEGREHGVVVVPAPSLAQQVIVLHALVGIEVAADSVDAHLTDALDKG